MFLGNTVSAASSGLDSIERQIALLSQNVANASTPNYTRQTLSLSSAGTGQGGPAGVRTGLATRSVDDHLQASVFSALGTEAGSAVTQAALEGIDQVSGDPGSGQDLASLLGRLRDSFSTLANDPASQSQQRDVIGQADALTNGLHTIGSTLVQARQTVQDALVQNVTTANDALHRVGALTKQIIAAKSAGQGTADLEDDRDGALRSLAQLTGARFIKHSNGDVLALAGNTQLPLDAGNGPFSLAGAHLSGGTPAASVPVLTLNGSPAVGLGGEIGARLTLRDSIVPSLQAGLDQFAQSLASTFKTQGLPLLTDPGGNVPTTATAGFALTIQVSASVRANPASVRDGTGPTVAAGDTTVIDSVLTGVFAPGSGGLPSQASAIVAGFAQQASEAKATSSTDTAVRGGLESRLSAVTGVSIDSELARLVQLQAAYGANAKVLTAVQDVWVQLLGVIR